MILQFMSGDFPIIQHYIPAAIMFLITVAFVTLLILPSKKFPRKNPLVNFYWCGFWVFLSLIASLSGARSTLMLLGVDPDFYVTEAIIASVILTFMLFVVFGWFRLSGKALGKVINYFRKAKPL